MENIKPLISISTGMFYFLDFERTLKIIKQSGIKNIEIAGYWLDNDWEVGQHLKNYTIEEIISLSKKYGLNISSFHDMSGAMYNLNDDVITVMTRNIIENYNIPCIVTHFPYVLAKNELKKCDFFEKIIKIYSDLIKNTDKIIAVENMLPIVGYDLIVNNVGNMLDFCKQTGSYINLDIVHVYESKLDLKLLVNLLHDTIKTIHISGYDPKKGRVLFSSDKCNIFDIFNYIDINKMYSITIESKIDNHNQSDDYYIDICKKLKKDLEKELRLIS